MNQRFTITASAEELMATSRQITGVDIVDTEISEALHVLIESCNHDAELTETSAEELEHYFLTLLCNRLRMQRDFANYPEIHDQVVKAPLIIVGMARTGSTKAQRLLASSGDFNYLPFWQAHSPASHTGERNEDTTVRVAEANRYADWVNNSSPEVKTIHEFDAHEADEEVFLLAHLIKAPYLIGLPEFTTFLDWLGAGNGYSVQQQMKFLRDALKYLQWQGLADPNKRWLLKTAVYFGLEPEIKTVFPDASLVMTHRLPQESVASMCSMMAAMQNPVSSRPLNSEVALSCLAVAANIDRHIANRATGAVKVADIWFQDLITNTKRVIRDVYAEVNEPLSDESLQRMLDWNTSNPQHAKGAHMYTLDDFGLTEVDVERDFANYIQLVHELFDLFSMNA